MGSGQSGLGRLSASDVGAREFNLPDRLNYKVSRRELKQAYRALGITPHDKLTRDLEHEFWVDSYNSIRNMQEVYDINPDEMHEMRFRPGNKYGTYASMNFDGSFTIQQSIRSDTYDGVQKTYEFDLKSGFHPQGTTVQDIMAHEYAHAIEAQLIRRIVPQEVHNMFGGATYVSDTNRIFAWADHTVANEILNTARANLGLTQAGFASAVKSLTGYGYETMQSSSSADSGHHETFAEALSAYARLGKNSGALATEVARLTKKMLKETRPQRATKSSSTSTKKPRRIVKKGGS